MVKLLNTKVIIRDFELSVSELLGAGFLILVVIVGSVLALQTKSTVLSCGAGPDLKLSAPSSASRAASSQESSTLDTTTRELFKNNHELKKDHKSDSEAKVQQTAKTRKNLMLDQMRQNPDGAIKQVLSAPELDKAQSLTQNCTETPATVEGSLEVVHTDFTNDSSADNYILKTAKKERIYIHPANKSKTKLTSGQQVKVKGYRLDNDLLVDASSPDSINQVKKSSSILGNNTAEAATGDTTGPQQTIVLMVYFQNTTQPALTQASVNNTIFSQMNSYYQETSYNQMSIAGTSVNWLKIPMDQTCDMNTGLDNVATAAVAAADPTVNFTNYNRIVIVANYGGLACGWSGVGTIGKTFVNTADGVVNASINWVDQGYMGAETHEFGHNLGLDHASFYNCGNATFSFSGCTQDEYGDPYSPMGSGATRHMNAPEKEFLGWLSPTQTQTVTTNGTYTIEPLETASNGLKSIRVQRSNGGSSGYNYTYYEYRTATGSDNGLNTNVLSGALLHNFTNTYTLLLDATPPGDKNTPALPVGGSYTDPATGSKVTLTTKTPTALTFNVVLGKTDFSTPTAAITYPAYDAAIKGSTTVTATANASSGIQKVDFYLDNAASPTFTATTTPYNYPLDTTQLTDGYHYIYAIATDNSGRANGVTGNMSGYATVRIVASNNAPISSNILPANQTFNPGDSLRSADGQYRAVMQGDGNLVVYNDSSKALWSTVTQGYNGANAVMQGDGNLVVYSSAAKPLWNSVTPGFSGAKTILQNDGNLVVYDASNNPLWSWMSGKIPSNTLKSNQTFNPGDSLRSADGQYRAVMQGDGNLVVYNVSGRALWSTVTQGYNGASAVMQGDGNFVVYNASSKPIWNSVTPGNAGSKLILQNDGNLVVYEASNNPLWSWMSGKL